MSTHKCPVEGCEKQVRFDILACWEHWQMIPKPQQRKVYAAWNNGKPLPDYPRVREVAIDAVNSLVAKT